MTDWQPIVELYKERAAMWRQIALRLAVILVIMCCAVIVLAISR